ncbi:VanZ family protein [Bacillus sp. AFS076308]|uniref:VanZ family protein n=1 Tax=Bacillus sp. AFS076308 TaxID=2033512 RepID=UPI0015969B84
MFRSLEIYRFSYIISWFLTILYAISDEYHQSFIPGRVSSLKDVFLFDSVGALLVLFITYLIKRKRI